MVQHIEHIIPQSIPHQITAVDDIKECQRLIAGDDALTFTHVILNLHEVTEAVQLMDQILKSPSHKLTCLVIITDHSQKNRIMEVASGYDYAQLEQDNRVRFIFKPVKPAKFAVIFDPEKERDLSTDRNKETALLAAVSERQIFDQVKEVLGNRGLKVLAVEDNLINLRVSTITSVRMTCTNYPSFRCLFTSSKRHALMWRLRVMAFNVRTRCSHTIPATTRSLW